MIYAGGVDISFHWGFHLWAETRLINEGCNDGEGWLFACLVL